MRIDTSSTNGDRSAERKIDGRSPLLTPPGTDATVVWAVATGPDGGAFAAATSPAPASGQASGISNAVPVGPPGVARIDTLVSWSAWVSRFVG